MSALLRFAARIEGIDHPVAVFKLNPSGAFCWSWQEPSNGYLVILDPSLAMRGAPLSAGKTFRSVNDHHFSYHSDGTRHRTVKAGAIKAAQHLGRQKTIALANIREWSSVRSVSVPLKGPFGSEIGAGVWRAVQRPEILRSDDFDGADGLSLHGYICRSDQVRNLITKWRVARHWTTGTRADVRLVVVAEPVFALRADH